jgi:hypothetical protein
MEEEAEKESSEADSSEPAYGFHKLTTSVNEGQQGYVSSDSEDE